MADSSSKVVVLPVDGSDLSFQAVEWYFANLHQQGAEVHIITTHHAPIRVFHRHHEESEKEQKEAQLRADSAAAEMLGRYTTFATSQGVEAKTSIITGDPRECIVQYAQEAKAALVLLGARGVSAVTRVLMGSTSDYVVHHCHCPVVVYRPKE